MMMTMIMMCLEMMIYLEMVMGLETVMMWTFLKRRIGIMNTIFFEGMWTLQVNVGKEIAIGIQC